MKTADRNVHAVLVVTQQECELARVDCLVSPLYRKRKLMTNTEAKELLGMCISECKRQAVDTAKQPVRALRRPLICIA